MKIFDMIRIAVKELKGFWTVLIAFGMAAAAFCLCFAGAILVSVSQEESAPYEINVSSNAGVKDADIKKISAIPDVKAATIVLQVPVTVNTGEYSAELTLTGIDSSYINEKFTQGGIFPDSSAMPYIILNKAACKAFTKPDSIPSADDTGDKEDVPDINWLSTGFTMQAGGEKSTVTAKVCGIFAGEDEDQQDQQDEQPESYISIAAAKELLKAEGQDEGSSTADVRVKNIGSAAAKELLKAGSQNAGLSAADVRVKNIGCAAAVSQAIENLGYQVSNPNKDLQKKWDGEYGEMAYLIVGGAFLLFLMAILSAARRKISMFQQKKAYAMLFWMGMREKEIKRLFIIQSAIISLIGITIGTIIALSLPSFLSQDLKGISVYMLPIPFEAVAVSLIICIITGLLSLLKIRKSIGFTHIDI